jgi:hypothetical protein
MKEETLFAAALERSSAADRQAFLDEACAGDRALRQRVERLLAAHEKTVGILERPIMPTRIGDAARPSLEGLPPVERVGHLVAGRYHLLEPIGEGGMQRQ